MISLRRAIRRSLEIHTGVAMASAIVGITINKILDLCRAHPQVCSSLNSVVCEMKIIGKLKKAEAEEG